MSQQNRVPAIAGKTFDELKDNPDAQELVTLVTDGLNNLKDPLDRARFLHQLVEGLNEEVFSHPIVQQMSPCKNGCTACCYTQVSATLEEAALLAEKINPDLTIDQQRLELQSKAGTNSEDYYAIPFQDRKCIFLNDMGACRVYEDRPMVCRTNKVLGDPEQCDTSVKIQPTRLVSTPKSDLVIYAGFQHTSESGTLPLLISKLLKT